MGHDFKHNDRVEFAVDGDFDRYKGNTNPDLYDLGTVIINGHYLDVKWDSDGEVTAPSLFTIRKLTTTRPHAELIKAWADGAEIQHFHNKDWHDVDNPGWVPTIQYRVKPEEQQILSKEIKLVAFIDDQGSLRWVREDLFASRLCPYMRVPSEDKIVTVEVTAK